MLDNYIYWVFTVMSVWLCTFVRLMLLNMQPFLSRKCIVCVIIFQQLEIPRFFLRSLTRWSSRILFFVHVKNKNKPAWINIYCTRRQTHSCSVRLKQFVSLRKSRDFEWYVSFGNFSFPISVCIGWRLDRLRRFCIDHRCVQHNPRYIRRLE